VRGGRRPPGGGKLTILELRRPCRDPSTGDEVVAAPPPPGVAATFGEMVDARGFDLAWRAPGVASRECRALPTPLPRLRRRRDGAIAVVRVSGPRPGDCQEIFGSAPLPRVATMPTTATVRARWSMMSSLLFPRHTVHWGGRARSIVPREPVHRPENPGGFFCRAAGRRNPANSRSAVSQRPAGPKPAEA